MGGRAAAALAGLTVAVVGMAGAGGTAIGQTTGVQPPVAAFTFAPASPSTGTVVTFDASSSTTYDGQAHYFWDLDGDGTYETDTGSTPTVTHTYARAGTVSVGLRVLDDVPDSDSVHHDVVIADRPPAGSFTVTPAEPVAGATAHFDASASTDPDGTVARYQWDLDGNGSLETDLTVPTVDHVYPDAGNRTVRLHIIDDSGKANDVSRSVHVLAATPTPTPSPSPSPTATPAPTTTPSAAPTPTAGPAPHAAFSAPSHLRPGLLGRFDATASTGTGLRYQWSFGGAAFDAGAAPVIGHGFPRDGAYSVVLRVIDAAGRSDTAAQVVRADAAPDGGLRIVPATPRPGRPVRFELTRRSAAVRVYTWDFGDGHPGSDRLGALRFPGRHPTAGAQTSHVYAHPGLYQVTAATLGDDGSGTKITGFVQVRAASGGRPRTARIAAAPSFTQQHVEPHGPSLEVSAYPATQNPVALDATIPEACITAPDAGGGKPGELAALLSGAKYINPSDTAAALLPNLAISGVPSPSGARSARLGGPPRARASASRHCQTFATFAFVGVAWGDGAVTHFAKPQQRLRLAETTPHTYTQPCQCTITATVRVRLDPDAKHPKGITSTYAISTVVDVVESWCHPVYLNGVAATTADGECWYPTGKNGFISPGGGILLGGGGLELGGAVVTASKDPAATGAFGAAALGPKLTLTLGGTPIGSPTSFTVPPGGLVKDVLGKGLSVGGLLSVGGDLRLGAGAPLLDMRFQLPQKITGVTQPVSVAAAQLADPGAGPALTAVPQDPPTFGGLSLPGLVLQHDAYGWHSRPDLQFALGPGLPSVSAPFDPAQSSGLGLPVAGSPFFGASVNVPYGQLTFLELLSLTRATVRANLLPTRLQGEATAEAFPITPSERLLTIDGGLGVVFPAGTGNTVSGFCRPGEDFDDSKDANGAVKPVEARFCGTARLAGIPIGEGSVTFTEPGHVAIESAFGYHIGSDLSLTGRVDGSADSPSVWQLHAGVTARETLIGDESVGAEGWLTPRGLAVCADIGVDVGGYATWSPVDVDYFLHACGRRAKQAIGAVRMAPDLGSDSGPTAWAAAVPSNLEVDAREPYHVFVVKGVGRAPLVQLTSPNGKRTFTDHGDLMACFKLSGARGKCRTAATHDNAIAHSDSQDTTLIYVRAPQKGTWKIATLPGSTEIARVDGSAGVPDPRLHVHVSPSHGAYVLGYSGHVAPGVGVTLTEVDGHGTVNTIAPGPATRAAVASARPHGRVRFTPDPSLGRKRRIVAELTVDGVPWKNEVVGRYTAPRPVVPGRPSHLRLSARGGRLRASWARARGAAHYAVTVTLGDGRVVSTATAKRSLSVPGYAATAGARLTVRAWSGGRVPSQPSTAALRARPRAALVL